MQSPIVPVRFYFVVKEFDKFESFGTCVVLRENNAMPGRQPCCVREALNSKYDGVYCRPVTELYQCERWLETRSTETNTESTELYQYIYIYMDSVNDVGQKFDYTCNKIKRKKQQIIKKSDQRTDNLRFNRLLATIIF